MNTASRFAFSAAAVLATAFSAPAQDLDAQVVRTPDDTVTYTVDFDGPPRGSVLLLTGIVPMDPYVRTPFGPLFLDPLGTFVVGQAQLDPFGSSYLRFSFPAPLVAGATFWFQSLNIDTANHWQLSPTFTTCLAQDLAVSSSPLPPNFGLVVKGSANSDAIGARFRLVGHAGTRYRIVVSDAQGNEVARREGRVPATGGAMHLEFEQGAGLRRGHRWRIEVVPASGAPSTVAAGTFD